MNDFFSKTLGGLSKEYYFRQLFFGLIIFGIAAWPEFQSNSPTKASAIIIFAIFTLLYPYSRFVYESIVEFVVGDNTFWASGFFLYLAFCFKIIMMCVCWALSVFIAPIGLLYLYFNHSKSGNSADKKS